MKIGIDCRLFSSNFTGIGRYTYELTKNLFKIDSKNHYVLFFNDPEFHAYIPPAHNVKKVLVNARHYSLAEQIKFLRALNKEKLDLMHFTHFNAPIFYFRPSIVTIHDLIVSFFPGRKNKSCLKKLAYNIVLKTVTKKAKKIIAVSEHTKKDLIKILKIKSEKISVIYEGIGEEFQRVKPKEVLELTKQKYGIDKPCILYTGVYRYHKNITGLLKAFKILKDKFHAPHKLVITGREDPYYPDVRRMAHDLGLKDDVIFAGLVPEEDLIALYSCADLHALPSFYEGFGFTPLEAMACGTPTAVSHTSSLPEICGKAAIFFDPHDIKEMASTLHKALADEDLRKRLIKAGYERVQMFKWENLAKQTLEVYNNLLTKNPAPPKT
ncbi:MAG: group 1 glycosyl transferase [Candidatus Peregrinibacteria bacterium GW2011_GWC2_39_14]|nr:MAG: Glycosyl transferase group 1 [Candidatus Peregrinibacteria bacterium GW2011_GWA2_38_36]KKR07158.1 MAG: group 1 glycosyl transferase [Candidatus Peregrinibacteria bacterium GW2011_GWC2_39_14]